MAHKMAGSTIVHEGEPLHVPTEAHADDTHYLELSPGGYNDLRPRKPQVKPHSSGVPPPGSGDSISGREGEVLLSSLECMCAPWQPQPAAWQ